MFNPFFLLISGLAPRDGQDLLSDAATEKLNDRIRAISAMNFAAVDLNLLRVFDAMMVELNTTRTGERVGLSQPAVSAALGRLRHLTGDALFVRDGNRMVPTTRAWQLSEPIRAALRQMEQALADVARFDPASATGTYRIVGSDYFSSLLMPPLARAVQEQAPGLTLQMLDRPSTTVVQLLSDGVIDLAVDARMEVPDWIRTRSLFRSFLVTVARRGEPALAAAGIRPGTRIPPEPYCAMAQVLMSMDGGRTGTMDAALAEVGLARRIAITVPHFHAVALTVAEAGLIGNLPVHFAERVAPALDLEIFLPPYDPPFVDVTLFWHRRHDADAARAWVRDRVADALTERRELTVPFPES